MRAHRTVDGALDRTLRRTLRRLAGTLALALLLATAVSPRVSAEDLQFLLVNAASADLTGFHITPSGSGSWEENLLDGGYLPPDHEIDVIIADGLTTCVYDILGVFRDGGAAEDYGLDLCELGEYTFTD